MAERYTQAFLREIKGTNERGREVRKAWQGVLKYREANPAYVERPEGEDTRKAGEKRRYVWRQVTRVFDSKAVRTKTQATKALAEWRDEMEREAGRPAPTTVTVPDYVDTFLDAWRVEGSTMQSYRVSAKLVREEFEDVALADLTGKMVNAWIAKLDKRYSLSMQGKAYRLLNLVCKHAKQDGDIEANPCEFVKPPARPKADPNALTKASRDRALKALAGGNSPLAVAASIALYMGLREGEICALRWKDVDLGARTLDVRKAIGKRKGGLYLKDTKTDGSARKLAIPAPMLDTLAARKARMTAECMEAGVPTDVDTFGELYVIGHVDGRFKNSTALSKEWHAFADVYGLMGTKGRRATFHDLRHTFATVAIAEGVDVKSVASFLGHTQTSTTTDIYASENPNAIRAAAEAMGRAMPTPAGSTTGEVLEFTPTGTEG